MSATDEYGLCRACGGHGAVMDGNRVNVTKRGARTVPNFVRCRWCDGRDKVTPLIEARAEAQADA